MFINLNLYDTYEEAKKDPNFNYQAQFVDDVDGGSILICGFCKDEFLFSLINKTENCPHCGNDIVYPHGVDW